MHSLRPAFSTFITHLLSLLGTPALPEGVPAVEQVILSPWQLDGLIRQRAAENLVAAGGTMGSLARLVRKIPNMAIPQEIRSDVLLTLSHLDKVHPGIHPTRESSLPCLRTTLTGVDMRGAPFIGVYQGAGAFFPSPRVRGKGLF